MNGSRTRSLLLACVAVPTLAGCALELVEPPLPVEASAHGLDISLQVDPTEVAPSGEFTATLLVTNTRSAPVALTTYVTCLMLPGVYRDGERVPFEGTQWGCGDAIWTHHLEPGQTITRSWEMRARLYAEQRGDPEGVVAPTGDYQVRADFMVFEIDGEPAELPTVEAPLRVR